MKRIWLVGLLLLVGPRASLRAEVDPADRFLQAYFLVQEADQAEQNNDWPKAGAKFKAALDILQEIKAQAPNWNPHIIDFRLKYCRDHLAARGARAVATPALPAPVAVTPATPTPPAPVSVVPPVTEPARAETTPATAPPVPPSTTPATPPPAPRAADTERVDQLTAELKQAREQIRQLETGREELNAKLQAALREIPSAEATRRVEQLAAKNQEMTTQLGAAQRQIAELTARVVDLEQARARIRQLEEAREQLSAKLKDALAKAGQNETDPRLAELLKNNQDLAAQLSDAQAQLTAARGGTKGALESAEMKQLRSQLAGTRTELERLNGELTRTRRDLSRTARDLETSRAETRVLRESYNQMVARLDATAKNLQAAQLVGKKDDQIIRFMRKENALLRQIVERKTQSVNEPVVEAGPRIPELKGWHPRRRLANRPESATAESQPTPSPTMTESARSKLVVELTAPPAGSSSAGATGTGKPGPVAAAGSASPALAAVGTRAGVVIRADAPAGADAGSDKARALIEEARVALVKKDYETAAARYRAVLETDPNNLLVLANLGAIRYQQGRLGEAEQSLRKAVAVAPEDSSSRAVLGIVCLRKGRTDEAFSELSRAVAVDPRNAEAHNYLGVTLSEKGWGADAEQELLKAVELDPQYADAHFNLALWCANQRTPRYQEARQHYEKAVELGAVREPRFETVLKSTATPAP